MTTPDPAHERQRLADLYASMSDGELDAVAQDSADLTDVARQALAEERSRRHTAPAIDEQTQAADEHIAWEDLVVVKQFRDLPEALLAKGSLESAGIEAFFADDNIVRMDWFISNLVGGIKLCVRPEDADAAIELLNQPIPADFDVEGEGPFQQPACPHCGALDVSYETLHKPAAYTSAWIGVPIPVPRERWRCNSCRAEWQDEPEE